MSDDIETPHQDGDATSVEVAAPTTEIIPAAAPRRNRLAIALILALVAVVTAGAVFAVVATRTGTPLADRVPADAGFYASVTLEPSAGQRAALQRLLGRLPEQRRERVEGAIDDALEGLFARAGVSWRSDVKPWVGSEVAMSVRGETGREPEVVALVAVDDEALARRTLQTLSASGEMAFRITDGIAYLGDSDAVLQAFQDAAASSSLADSEAFTRDVERLGDGLAMFWGNPSRLATFARAPGLGPLAGLSAAGAFGGTSAAVLRAEEEGLVFASHGKLPPGSEPGSGVPALVGGTADGTLAALTMFDLAAVIEQLLELGRTLAGSDEFGVDQGVAFFEQATGIDVENDLLPWLRGEFSIVFGGLAVGEPIPARVGILIDPTDPRAAARTLRAIETRLPQVASGIGEALAVVPQRDGFDIRIALGTVAVRRSNDRVVIATSAAYASELLRASRASLAEDEVYRRAVGTDGERVAAQVFVRVDRIRELIEGFMPAGERVRYEQDVQPILGMFEALGMRATIAGDQVSLRVLLTIAS